VSDLFQTSAECNYIDCKWDYSPELFICKFSVEPEGHTLKRTTTSFKKQQGRTRYLCCCCLCKETIDAFLKWHKLNCVDVSQSHKLLILYKHQVVHSWMRSVLLCHDGRDEFNSSEMGRASSERPAQVIWPAKGYPQGEITLSHACITSPFIAQWSEPLEAELWHGQARRTFGPFKNTAWDPEVWRSHQVLAVPNRSKARWASTLSPPALDAPDPAQGPQAALWRWHGPQLAS